MIFGWLVALEGSFKSSKGACSVGSLSCSPHTRNNPFAISQLPRH
jgi:hypothetical protein